MRISDWSSDVCSSDLFIARLGDLESRQKAGKAVINVSATANVLAPARVADTSTDRLALVTAEGRLLVFPLAELPELAKGKGNKLVALTGEDRILASCVLPADASLTLVCGNRTLSLKTADLVHSSGSLALRAVTPPTGKASRRDS